MSVRLVVCWLLLGSLLVPLVGRAAAAGPERLDLATCIARALKAAPVLAEAQAEVAEGQARLSEAKVSRFLPEASVTTVAGAAPQARGTVQHSLDSTTTRSLGPFTRVEVSFVQPLFTGGKIVAGIAAATHAVEQSLASRDAKAGEIVEQVTTLYYNVLLARSVGSVLDEASDAFATALKTAQERRDHGDPKVTEVDLLNLRIAAAEVAKDIPRLAAGEADALEALRRLIGAQPTDPIDLQQHILDPEAGAVKPLADYEQMLFERNTDWRQVTAGLAAKQEEAKTVEADFYPTVFLEGSFAYAYAPERDRQRNPFAYDDFNYLHGPGAVLGIRWLLNFHVTAARAATKRAEVAHLEAAQRSARSGLPVELHHAYRHVQETEQAMARLNDGRRAGRALLTATVANFDLGIGDAKEILDGLGNYARVSSDHLEAVRDYNVARAALARVTGTANTLP